MKLNKYETSEIIAAFVGAVAGTFIGIAVSAEAVILYLISFG